MDTDKAEHSSRIIAELEQKYPGTKVFDLDGRGQHFVCEVEPTDDHPEYDVAVEVILSSKPHKHLKMTQFYKILSGTMTLFVDNDTVSLKAGDSYTIHPGQVHWAQSEKECWVEIRSEPGWTAEDHIVVEQE